MGNKTTIPIVGVDDQHPIKWKQGVVDRSLPFSHHCQSYEELRDSKELKDYILHHLDDDGIIDILLDKESCDEHLVKSLQCFREYSTEERLLVEEELNSLENCGVAGINVKLSEAINVVTKHLGRLSGVTPSLFTYAAQRKFTMLSSLGKGISQEFDRYVKAEKSRRCNFHDLNSIKHPQIKLIFDSYKFGIDILQMLGRLCAMDSGVNPEPFMAPVRSLCDSMKHSVVLDYFKCWSPRPAQSRKLITSDGFKFIHNSTAPNVGQSSSSTFTNFTFSESSTITIALTPPKALSSVRLNWMSSHLVTAPERYAIYLKKSEEESFYKLGSFYSDEEKIRIGSWNQIHWIGSIQNNEYIESIKIVVSKSLSRHNTTEKCSLSELCLYEHDNSVVDIRTIEMLLDMNSSLFQLMRYPSLKAHVFPAMIGNIRSSGSLFLLLELIKSIITDNSILNECMSTEEVIYVNQLLLEFSNQENEIIGLVHKLNKGSTIHMLEDVCGDQLRSQNCKIVENNCIVFSRSEIVGHCIFKIPAINNSILQIEISINGADTVQVGFIEESDKYELMIDTKKCSLTPFQGINDRVVLVYDYKKQVVFYSVDGKPMEILLEGLEASSFPILVCEAGHDTTVRIPVLKSTLHESFKNSPDIVEKNDFSQVEQGATYFHVSSSIVIALGLYCKFIARTRSLLREYGSNQSISDWEYPFGIDISLETFRTINDLLFFVVQNNGIYSEEWVSSLLTILRLQLDVLCEVSSPLSEIIFSQNQQFGQIPNGVNINVFNLLSHQLKDLVRSQTFGNRQLAMSCFSSGVLVFFPGAAERATLISDILAGEFESPSNNSKSEQITIVLNSFNRIEELRQLISSFLLDANQAATISASISYMIQMVIQTNIDSFNNVLQEKMLTVESLSLVQSYIFRFFECLFHAKVFQSIRNSDEKWCDHIIVLVNGLVQGGEAILKRLQNLHHLDDFARDKLLKNSLVGKVTFPLLHLLTVRGIPSKILYDIVDSVVSFTDAIVTYSASCTICKEALYLVATCVSPHSDTFSSVKGWKTVKAHFEDGDNSYTLSENRSIYTSAHSSNTCAIVNHRFTKGQRGAWEFQLETDSLNDECSVFGAARMPLSSRCYTSSPDLWMRRAYNGYMYCLGQTTGNSLDKIHPGDVVRIEFDGVAGTLSYSVNGGNLEVGFTGITDDVYPACGSYRNGVAIRLLKVEVFDSIASSTIDDDFAEWYPTADISWRSSEEAVQASPSSSKIVSNCLHHPGALDSKINKKISNGGKWLTSFGTRGAAMGVHRWDFTFLSQSVGRFSIGIAVGSESLLVSSTRLSDLTSNKIESAIPRYFVFNSDGSLWCDGKKVSVGFDVSSCLPFKKGTTISLVCNRVQRTLEILIDNKSLGLAFGPKSSGALSDIALPLSQQDDGKLAANQIIFPAASVYSLDCALEILGGGFKGSTVIPFALSASFGMSSICGRVTSGLLESNPSVAENQIHELLESPMFVGGLDEEYVALNKEFSELNQAIEVAMKSAYPHEGSAMQKQSKDSIDDHLFYRIASAKLDPTLKALYDWLDNIDPEPASIRKVLEKASSYNFPDCELPVLACMIKHAEMEDEIRSFLNNPDCGTLPSENLVLIWQKVKQLRNYLRKQRQSLKNAEESNKAVNASVLTELVADRIGIGAQIQWLSLELVDQTNDISVSGLGEPAMQVIGVSPSKEEVFLVVENYQFSETLQTVLLTIEGEEFKSNEYIVTTSGLLVIWFDLSKPKIVKISALKSFDVSLLDNTSEEPKVRSRLLLGNEIKAETDSDSFQKLCKEIQAKASFLLMLRPTSRLYNLSNKFNFIGMSSIYSTSFTPFGPSKADLSKRKTQERWKRVVEYLHVQSKLHRQLSSESIDDHDKLISNSRSTGLESSLDDSSRSGNDSELSNCQAAIQACSNFILSEYDRSFIRISNICEVLKVRVERSQFRLKGFQTIEKMLRLPAVYSNVQVLLEYLVIIKNVFPPKALPFSGSKKLINHYLSTLEGCPMNLLSHLQSAAGNVFNAVSQIFENLILEWERPSVDGIVGSYIERMRLRNSCLREQDYANVICLIIQMWTVEFSSRDSQWIIDSGIVPLLHRLSSHYIQERTFNLWSSSADALVSFIKNSHQKFDKDAFIEVPIWNTEKVKKGLASGSLSARQILVHLIVVCASNFSKQNMHPQVSLDTLIDAYEKKNFSESRYFALLENVMSKKVEQKQAQSKSTEPYSEEQGALGCFDPNFKAGNIVLSDSFCTATLRQNREGTSLCVYGTISYKSDTVQEVGNYFEVTILAVGDGDIGIGFANRHEFSFTGNMPGWVSHSYGYHGDDGKKYGEGSTPGDWPLFENGDIIGCGIDFDRRVIFYTRNGEFLGDAFRNITIEEYWPIIGFSNRHSETNKVSINFGLSRFAFSSSSILPNRQVMAKLLSESSKDAESITESSHDKYPTILPSTVAYDRIDTLQDKLSDSMTGVQARQLFKVLLRNLEQYEQKVNLVARCGEAASVLSKFFVFQTTKSSSLFLENQDTEPFQDSSIPLARGISAFGSSKELNASASARLVNSIASIIGEDLLEGTHFLQPIQVDVDSFSSSALPKPTFPCLRSKSSIHLHQQLHLSLINQLCLSSPTFIRELANRVWLTSLFRMLDVGNTKNKLTVIGILRKLLPIIEPEVADKYVPLNWKEEITRGDDEIAVALQAHVRKSNHCDVVVRKFLCICGKAFAPDDELCPFGVGDTILSVSFGIALLIQKLSRFPQWSEIVARNITSILRYAHICWNNPIYAVELKKLAPVASAAALCISFKPGLSLGSRIVADPNIEGIVIAEDSIEEEMHIVLRSSRGRIGHLGEIEKIKKSKISIVSAVMNVNSLSQPVVPQLLELGKSMILWVLERGAHELSKSVSNHELTMINIIFGAINNLMEWSSDTIGEALFDGAMLTELLKSAATPSPLQQIHTIRELELLWRFVQARRLEGLQGSVTRSIPELLPALPAISGDLANSQFTSTLSTKYVEVSDSTRFSRTEMVETFRSQHHISFEDAQKLVEYCMLDTEKASSLLSTVPKIEAVSSDGKDSTFEAPKRVILDDSNVFKGLEHASFSNFGGKKSNYILTKTVREFSSSSGYQSEGWPLKLFVQCAEEGISPFDAHEICFFDQKCEDDKMIVSFFDTDLDSCFLTMVPESTCKCVERIGSWELSRLDHLAENIDLAIAIASIRNIVMILVSSGYINACTFAANGVDFVSSAKLLSLTSSSEFNQTLTSLFTALGSDTLDDGQAALQHSIAESMASDVRDSLIAIRDGNTSFTARNSRSTKKKYVVSSTHPFNAPHVVEGKIVGDSDWKGVTVSFDTKCSTPSERAKLMFYSDEMRYSQGQPDYTFYGSCSTASSFKNFSIPDVKQLFYRFEAQPLSHLPDVNLVALVGKYTVQNDNITSAANNNPVGLGDDDTLFNLFDLGASFGSTSSTITTDVHVPNGNWVFQIEIVAIPSEEEIEKHSTKNIWLGLDFHEENYEFGDDYFIGSDDYGIAVNNDGKILHGNVLLAESVTSPFEIEDIITFLVFIQDSSLTLSVSKNGSAFSDGVTMSRKESTKGVTPGITIPSGWSVRANFGNRPFKLLPCIGIEGVSSICESQQSTLRELSWGYQFTVSPVDELLVSLTRDFDLVWQSREEDGSVSSAIEKVKNVWVWRPKARDNFYPVADIITEQPFPPSRHLLIERSQCVHPTKFLCVFYHSKQNVVIWRPIPPTGYVALGDVVCQGSSSSTPPATSTVVCVPLWSVKASKANEKVFTVKKVGEGKNIHNGTFWRLSGHQSGSYGYFFGSPFEKSSDDTLKAHSDFQFNGIGQSFTFIQSFQCEIDAEWHEERDVNEKPSFSWILATLQSLMNSEKHRHLVLKSDVFLGLVDYMRSNQSVYPLKIVPILIQMIRNATALNVSLPFHELKNLCKAILTEASNITQVLKKTELPRGLMMLVDFVVEIQAVHVVESSLKDRQAISRNMERGKLRLHDSGDLKEESKEEADDINIMDIECSLLGEASSPSAGGCNNNCAGEDVEVAWKKMVTTEQERRWWDRSALHSHEMKLHRVIKKDNLENLFCKESTLLKLKQVLKFLFAINGGFVGKTFIPSKDADLALERSFPKLMTSKLWYDHICSFAFFESHHPYKEKKYVRKASFPGGQNLVINFDRRCALSKGDKLILRTDKSEIVLESGNEEMEKLINNGTQFPCTELSIIFVPGNVMTLNEENEWGWALLVGGSGPIYEIAETSVDLSLCIRHYVHQLQLQEEISLSRKFKNNLMIEDGGLESSIGTNIQPSNDLHDDSGSEASGPTSVLETIENVAPVVGVGMSSDDVLPPELGGEPLLSPTVRPVSKRGKRDSKGTSVKSTSIAAANTQAEAVSEDPEIVAIKTHGSLVKTGDIGIPYASSLEIAVERFTPSKGDDESNVRNLESLNFTFVIEILSNIATEVEAKSSQNFKLTPNSQAKCIIAGSRADYFVFALESQKLQEIMEPVKDKANENQTADTVIPESVVAPADAASVSEVVASVEETPGPLSPAEPLLFETLDDEWSCPLCTYLNPRTESLCGMCGAGRPEEEGSAGIAPSADALWCCPQCTLLNRFRVERCAVCDHPRVGTDMSLSEHGRDERPEEEDADNRSETDASPSGSPKPLSPSKLTGTQDRGAFFSQCDHDCIKITAKGKLDSQAKFETRLEAAILSKGQIMTPLQVHHRVSSWSKESDEALLVYLNRKNGCGKIDTPVSFALSKHFLTYEGEVLSTLNMLDIIIRSQLIEAFNKQLEALLPFIDLSSDDPSSFGTMIRRSNKYLLNKIKQPLLDRAISNTAAKGSEPGIPGTLVLDNFKALTSREAGECDIATSSNCFVQAFKQLHRKDSVIFRHCFSTDRVFQITFADESGIDAGGVFREGVSRIIEDLFSEYFNLLVLCPNGQQAVYTSMDKFLPNPKQCGPLALEMFNFVGKLMAMSIRVKLCLPFEFPLLIWKKIVGEEVSKNDLIEIDVILANQLEDIENCHLDAEDPVTDDEGFVRKFTNKLRFTYMGSDGIERDACILGSSKEVTFENRLEYVSLVRTARLNEFNLQVAAIVKGMGEVIPMRALLLFSAEQLAELVCGNPKIDIELWKSQTDSSVSSALTKLFWKVMEDLSPSEQAGFIRFAWGRSRLPSKKEDFTTRMKLVSGGRAALPVSHTCFFSVELPSYTTEEEMRHGLLTAIHFGVGGILNG